MSETAIAEPVQTQATINAQAAREADKAAREAAGMNLRRFAEAMDGPSFKTWSMIETGQRSASAGRIPEDVWKRVRDFIAQHKPEANPNSEKGSA